METIKKLQLNGVEYELGGVSEDHTHDDKYSNLGHTHDDRYYTETEVDALLKDKAESDHNHDDKYLSLNGGKVNGHVYVGENLDFYSDTEGGNIRLVSPKGNAWEMDAHNEDLRIYNDETYNAVWIHKATGDVVSGQGASLNQTLNMRFYKDPINELGVTNDATFGTIFSALPDMSSTTFWINDNTFPNIYTEVATNASPLVGLTHAYGNVTVSRHGSFYDIKWECYNRTVTLVNRYTTINNNGWTGWAIDTCKDNGVAMTLKSASGCSISGFSGIYFKYGRLVWFRCSFTIAKSGSGDILIDCLPYTPSYKATCPIDYHNAIFKASGGSAYTSLSAGVNGGSTALNLYGWSSGRSWTMNSTDINTSGTINLSGTYIATI